MFHSSDLEKEVNRLQTQISEFEEQQKIGLSSVKTEVEGLESQRHFLVKQIEKVNLL